MMSDLLERSMPRQWFDDGVRAHQRYMLICHDKRSFFCAVYAADETDYWRVYHDLMFDDPILGDRYGQKLIAVYDLSMDKEEQMRQFGPNNSPKPPGYIKPTLSRRSTIGI